MKQNSTEKKHILIFDKTKRGKMFLDSEINSDVDLRIQNQWTIDFVFSIFLLYPFKLKVFKLIIYLN